MKTTREHLWDAIAKLPNAAAATANFAWQNMPNFQESSTTMTKCFNHNPWIFLTMPHEEFTTSVIMGDTHYSPFHLSYFP